MLPIENYRYELSSTNVMTTDDNKSDKSCAMELHEKIKAERLRRGMSQADVGKLVGISQPAVKKIESGTTVRSRYVEEIARKLGVFDERDQAVSAGLAALNEHHRLVSSFLKPEPEFLGAEDLPVYSAVEGGPGEMVISTDPIDLVPRPWFFQHVKDAYAVIVTGDSMDPIYEPGDMVLVNPRLPCIKGKDAIYVAGEDRGEFRASIKRFVGVTETHWLAKQYSPVADLKLDRKTWTRAVRVVGKYSG